MHVFVVEARALQEYHSSKRHATNLVQAGDASGLFSTTRVGVRLPRGRRRPWRKAQQLDAAWAPPTTAADLVHFTLPSLARYAGHVEAATVATHHDLVWLRQLPARFPSPWALAKRRSLSPLYAWLSRRDRRQAIEAMLRTDHIVAVSQTMADELCAVFPAAAGRVSVVPNMVGAHITTHADSEAWLAGRGVTLPQRPRVLMVGHTGAYKNVGLALRSMAQPELREATLVHVGQELAPEQRALAARLGVRLLELGRVDDATIAQVYCACDVLIQPSLWEGFGIPVIEAFAAGTPVVTSDGGALPEVVGDAGIVVPGSARAEPQTSVVSSFADAIASLLNDPARRRELRERGLARAERFRPARVGVDLAAAYEKAIAAHARGDRLAP